jgi:hypothetical protein
MSIRCSICQHPRRNPSHDRSEMWRVAVEGFCHSARGRLYPVDPEIEAEVWCARGTQSRDHPLVALGLTYREMGEQYGVSRQRAQQIVRLYGGA